MYSKFSAFGISFIFTFGLTIHQGNGQPQFFKTLSGQEGRIFERTPKFEPSSEGFPDYLSIFRQLSDNSHLASKNVPALRTKFDPKSLRVSRVAEPPTRPPPLDPVEQSRLQQEYADRSLREQQQAAHGLGRSKPKPGGPSPSPAPAAPIFKPFPIYYNKDPTAQLGTAAFANGGNFDHSQENFNEDHSLESGEVTQYQRPLRPRKPSVAQFGFEPPQSSYNQDDDSLESGELSRYQSQRIRPKKPSGAPFVPKKTSYAYDERFFR
uniref:Uncharacterized protein n=1 Tax=Cacopsylla melanoneura TaxID=428564 RepID=A0A8D9BI37_9HEMI